ncbi:hypothetical protein THIOM_000143 [Candidatus Thiomargarita nelsonii]|uniref:Uncharacterized protein n=1 Tax=Candidatus Thiomargarita nelsonii TaxID=1003181 RepID=A0A176S7W1_9GAMM|nr:hypothetical protein THIOM_000143 [Candidatus Thiomargarita nelsonii]
MAVTHLIIIDADYLQSPLFQLFLLVTFYFIRLLLRHLFILQIPPISIFQSFFQSNLRLPAQFIELFHIQQFTRSTIWHLGIPFYHTHRLIFPLSPSN